MFKLTRIHVQDERLCTDAAQEIVELGVLPFVLVRRTDCQNVRPDRRRFRQRLDVPRLLADRWIVCENRRSTSRKNIRTFQTN
jgi:hypothetical protein